MQSGVALGRQRFRFRVDSALAGLALVIAAAAALRFGTLATQSYWYDESLTVELTKTAFGLKALGVGVHGEAEPPLYFGLAWLWARPFGHGEAGLRSLSAACGVLTVPVVYSAAKTLFNVRTAVVAGLLTAMIAQSREFRFLVDRPFRRSPGGQERAGGGFEHQIKVRLVHVFVTEDDIFKRVVHDRGFCVAWAPGPREPDPAESDTGLTVGCFAEAGGTGVPAPGRG